MEFSDTYKHSGHCVFSPDARFLAVAVDYRLVIRDVASLKVRRYCCAFMLLEEMRVVSRLLFKLMCS